jgi:hypothetical protein
MHAEIATSRRRFLGMTGSIFAGLALPAIPCAAIAADKKEAEGQELEVTPVEDLMREHGVLRRVLLIYEETARRLDEAKDLPLGVIADSAGIIRRVVEDYHEKLIEEDELFGNRGFERMVDQVAGIEKKLGIFEPSQFMPKL